MAGAQSVSIGIGMRSAGALTVIRPADARHRVFQLFLARGVNHPGIVLRRWRGDDSWQPNGVVGASVLSKPGLTRARGYEQICAVPAWSVPAWDNPPRMSGPFRTGFVGPTRALRVRDNQLVLGRKGFRRGRRRKTDRPPIMSREAYLDISVPIMIRCLGRIAGRRTCG
jgi:hypothetical protein